MIFLDFTIWFFSFVTIWVFVFCHNWSFWFLSQFDFFSFVTILVYEFCHNLIFFCSKKVQNSLNLSGPKNFLPHFLGGKIYFWKMVLLLLSSSIEIFSASRMRVFAHRSGSRVPGTEPSPTLFWLLLCNSETTLW